MELDKINQLLESYFEGTTSVAQEQTLKEYFTSNQVDHSLIMYKNLFAGLAKASTEHSTATVTLPTSKRVESKKAWWLSIAATVLVVVGVLGYLNTTNNQMTAQEKEAIAALKESKKAMLLLSKNFNTGIKQLELAHTFSNTTSKYLK